MPSDQIPTYHLAPNFSIGPAPNGPIELGSIIKNLQGIEVLNEECHLDVAPEKLYCHHKMGFRAKRGQMRKGELGLWAQFVGSTGIGGEASWTHEREEEDEYNFKREDTIYFSPTADYIKKSMAEPDVAEYVEGTGHKPVYMVTGLKIAREPSVKLVNRQINNVVTKVGVHQGPVEVGLKVGVAAGDNLEEGWDISDDFIYGIRVKKLVFKKTWFSRHRQGELEAKEHNEGARLVDANDLFTTNNNDEDVIELAIDAGELEGKTEMQENYDGMETNWVVPKV